MGKKKTKEQFISEAKTVHGDKYDYSNVEYKNNYTKVCIICPIHGEFYQNPSEHLRGQGCRHCGNVSGVSKRKLSFEEFIYKSKIKHNNKYDYSKVDLEHRDKNGKVCIICPIHGEFWQKPTTHISGRGCSKCGGKDNLTTEEFIKKCNIIHKNKYIYSKTNYINNKKEVCIICPIHGEFWQIAKSHLEGNGCSKCRKSSFLDA